MSVKDKAYARNIIKQFVEEISSKYSVSTVYLFGSYSSGNNTNDSDIDVVVVLNESLDDEKEFLIFKIAQKINHDLEPVIFSSNDFECEYSDLIVEIKTKGEKVA